MGALTNICHSAAGRPAVAQQLHGLGIVEFLVEILNQSGPLQWVSYTALLQPGSTGGAMWCMKEMIAGLLASGTDITPVLVSTGYADMLVSALKAIDQVGVEEVCDIISICACDNHQPASCLCSCPSDLLNVAACQQQEATVQVVLHTLCHFF